MPARRAGYSAAVADSSHPTRNRTPPPSLLRCKRAPRAASERALAPTRAPLPSSRTLRPLAHARNHHQQAPIPPRAILPARLHGEGSTRPCLCLPQSARRVRPPPLSMPTSSPTPRTLTACGIPSTALTTTPPTAPLPSTPRGAVSKRLTRNRLFGFTWEPTSAVRSDGLSATRLELTSLIRFFSDALLIVIGHMRDFLGKWLFPAEYSHLQPSNVSESSVFSTNIS